MTERSRPFVRRNRGAVVHALIGVLAILVAAAVLVMLSTAPEAPERISTDPEGALAKENLGPDGAPEAAELEQNRESAEGAEVAVAEADSEGRGEGADEELAGTGLRGRVIGRDGRPAASAEVVVERSVSARDAARFGVEVPAGQSSTRFERRTVSGPDGHFAVADLPPAANYEIRAWNDEGDVGARRGLDVIEGRVSDIGDIALRRGARVAGILRSDAGRPVAGARVSFGVFWKAHPVTTDEKGRFDAGVLLPGRHVVRVQADGYALPQGVTLELIEGDVIDDLELVVVRAAPIRGRVVDRAGRPVADAWVSASQRREPGDVFAWLGSGNQSARTDSSGRFAFESLPPGVYDLSAGASGYETGQLQQVEAGGAPVELVVSRFAAVRFVCVDAATSKLVEPREIRLLWRPPWNPDPDAPLQDFWDDPRFEVEDDGSVVVGLAQPGRYAVAAVADGYAWGRSDPFEIVRGTDRTGLVIRLERGRDLEVHVVAASTGEPVAGAIVDLHQDNEEETAAHLASAISLSSPSVVRGRRVARVIAGDDGTARIRSVSNGRFDLFARADGLAEGRVDALEILPGVPIDPIEIRLSEGGAIEGVVRTDKGRPEPARRVFVEDKEGVKGETVTREQGDYAFRHLAPGKYRVRADELDPESPVALLNWFGADATEPEDPYPVVVEEGGVTRHDLVVEDVEPGSLFGTVLLNGAPAAGFQVSAALQKNGGGPFVLGFDWGNVAKVDEGGKYRFRRLKPGRYRLTVGRSWMRMLPAGEVDVVSNQDTVHAIDLRLGGLAGRVVDDRDRPVAGATVRYRRQDDGASGSPFGSFGAHNSATTDQDGAFFFQDVQDGTYSVSASAEGYSRDEVEVDVRAPRTTSSVQLRLREGGWARLFVSGASSVAMLSIRFEDENGNRVSRTVQPVSDDGVYWIDLRGRTKGVVVVESVGSAVQASGRAPVRSERGENVDVAVRLGSG